MKVFPHSEHEKGRSSACAGQDSELSPTSTPSWLNEDFLALDGSVDFSRLRDLRLLSGVTECDLSDDF